MCIQEIRFVIFVLIFGAVFIGIAYWLLLLQIKEERKRMKCKQINQAKEYHSKQLIVKIQNFRY